MPKVKKFLPAVIEIWVQTDTQDQLLVVIGPVVNKNLVYERLGRGRQVMGGAAS